MPAQSPFTRTATPGEMDQPISFLTVDQTVDDGGRRSVEHDPAFNLKRHLREGQAADRNRDIGGRHAHGAHLRDHRDKVYSEHRQKHEGRLAK